MLVIGDLRFRAPRAPFHIKGVQNATQQPDQCWQDAGEGQTADSPYFKRDANPVPASNEDCLFLKCVVRVRVPAGKVTNEPEHSVHVPASLDLSTESGKADGLPVLVWIHGGGYAIILQGSSTTLILNRTAFRYDSGSNAFYPVELFVRDSGYKLISINIQYRLAAFGVYGRIFGVCPQLNVPERILGWKGSKTPWRPQCRIASVLIEMTTF